MEVVSGSTLLPGDPRLIDHIVCELKSQGIFDQFRKECIADVDTKPAYQNLRQRVEGSVTGFLNTQTWRPDMNKNHLREMLRKNIYESGFLETGVERIVDQVVNPKINTVFLPEVEDVVYKFFGLEKPQRLIINRLNGPLTINALDLLPTDLDPISPDSEVLDKSLHKTGDTDKIDDSSKLDDFESPPFELITEQSFMPQDDSSNDSHLSAISGLTSNSNASDHASKNVVIPEFSNQDSQLSKVSSNSRLSIITSDDKHSEKMDISDDTQNSKIESAIKVSENGFVFNLKQQVDAPKSDGFVENEVTSEIKAEETPEEAEAVPKEPEKVREERDKSKSDRSRRDSDRKSSSKYDKEKKSERSDKDKKEKSRSGSSSKDKYREKKDSSKSKDKENRDKDREKDKKDKHKDEKDPKKDDKKESSKDRDSKSDKDKYKSSSSSKQSSRDRSSSKSDRKDSSRDKSKGEPSSHTSKDSKSEKRSSDSRKSDTKSESKSSSAKDRDRSRTDSRKDSKSSSSKDKDRRDSKKSSRKDKEKDDHSSVKDKKTDGRRSTDRDSNDGSTGNTANKDSAEPKAPKAADISENSQTSGDSNQSNSEKDAETRDSETFPGNDEPDAGDDCGTLAEITEENQNEPLKMVIRKPKFASNIFEARKLMKVRKKMERMERKRLLKLAEKNEGISCVVEVPVVETDVSEPVSQAEDKADVDAPSKEANSDDLPRETAAADENRPPREPSPVAAPQEIQTEELNEKETPINSVVSKASWDALEATLTENMLKIDYDSYGDENMEVPCSSKSPEDNSSRRKSEDEDCLYFSSQVSPKTERYLKQMAILQKIGPGLLESSVNHKETVKMAPPHLNTDRGSRRSRKPNSKYCSGVYTSEIMFEDGEDVDLAEPPKHDVSPIKKTKKRKFDIDRVDTENNNKKIHTVYEVVEIPEMDYEDEHEPSPCASNTSSSSIEHPLRIRQSKAKKLRKSDLTSVSVHNDSFPLPLSPESDMSGNSFEVRNPKSEPERETATKTRSSSTKCQRYSSDDLYKPRPFVSGTRRTRANLNTASRDSKINR